MNVLAYPRCSSPLTPSSISSPVSSARIKIRRSLLAAHRHHLTANAKNFSRIVAMAAAAPASSAKEVLPPSLTATSEPPPLFDGTTRLYVAYHCPYAQRAWIARNYKGLQDKIKIVAIDLADRPAWYKEKVYPENKVPSLEHNNQVKGESLDLVKYTDSNFEGPALLPDDSAKKQFAEELLAYSDAFNKALFSSTASKGDVSDEAVAALDKIEASLGKFNDGPFFLGQFSLVDIAYAGPALGRGGRGSRPRPRTLMGPSRGNLREQPPAASRISYASRCMPLQSCMHSLLQFSCALFAASAVRDLLFC